MRRFVLTIVLATGITGCKAETLVPPSPGVKLVQNATSSGLPTVAEFGATTCASCRTMRVVLDSVAQKTRGRANVLIIDISKDWQAAEVSRIQLMPTQVFFGPDGRETGRHIGKLSEAEVVSRLGLPAIP